MSFLLVWRHKIISFLSKQFFFCSLIRFHLLVLTLNYRNVFAKTRDVTIPHLLLCDVRILSILIENIVLEESQENISITSIFITLPWVQRIKTSFWGSSDLIMMSQAPRPKVRLVTGSFLLSDTKRTIFTSQTFLRKKRRKIWNCDLSERPQFSQT